MQASTAGAIQRIVRIASEPVATSDAIIEEYKRAYLEYLSREADVEVDLERFRETLDAAEYAPFVPATMDVKIDAVGHIWLGRFEFAGTPAHRWEVFDDEGVWMGSVTTPEGLVIQELGSREILGLARDELGVTYVRVHEIEKTEGGG